MRSLFVLFAAFAAFALLAGCGGKSVVGKWDMTMSSSDPNLGAMLAQMGEMKEAFEFKSDDTFTFSVMGQSFDGTYKMEDDKVTLTPTGETGEQLPPALTMSEDGESMTGTMDTMTMTLKRSAEAAAE